MFSSCLLSCILDRQFSDSGAHLLRYEKERREDLRGALMGQISPAFLKNKQTNKQTRIHVTHIGFKIPMSEQDKWLKCVRARAEEA